MRVNKADRVKVHVGVEPKGEPIGLHEGGVVKWS